MGFPTFAGKKDVLREVKSFDERHTAQQRKAGIQTQAAPASLTLFHSSDIGYVVELGLPSQVGQSSGFVLGYFS